MIPRTLNLNVFRHAMCLFVAILLLGTTGLTVQAQDTNKEAAEAFNAARADYQAKNYEGAYTKFKNAMNLANNAGDRRTAASAKKAAYQLAYKVGSTKYQAGDLAGALKYFNEGIELEPTYFNNYKGKALVVKQQGTVEEAMQAWIKAAEVATQAGDLEERNKAYTQAEGFSAQALADEDYAKAVEYGTMYIGFRDSEEVRFHLAHASNQLGKREAALEHADKGLELSRGSRTSKAKLNFEKADALEQLGRFSEAVAAYREAAVGDYAQRARYKIDELGGGGGSQ